MHIHELIIDINNAAESIKLTPPRIVLDIFEKGKIKNNAGTKKQYFSTLVFIQGVCRSLAYDCVNNFVYLFDEESLSIENLIHILPRYLRSNANFLRYCGFDQVWLFAKAIMDSLPLIETKDQLKILLNSYNYYLANLYTWVQHYFPWHLGENFPLNKTETNDYIEEEKNEYYI